MLKYKYTKYAIVLVAITVLVLGCKSKHVAVSGEGEIQKKERNEIIKDALKAQIEYHTISTKGSIALGDMRSNAVFKIVKDSIIQVSVRPFLGMEAARITFTPDSIFFIDRMKKRYLAENFKGMLVEKGIDFNFYNLQALFTNQLFAPGENRIDSKDYNKFKSNSTKESYILNTVDKNKLMYNFALNASNRITSTFVTDSTQKNSLQWTYSDFVNDGDFTYPKMMSAKVKTKDKTMLIYVSYSSLDIDSKLEVDNSIPKSYSKVSTNTLIERLLNTK